MKLYRAYCPGTPVRQPYNRKKANAPSIYKENKTLNEFGT